MQEERERLLAFLKRTRLPFWIWRLAECLIDQPQYTIMISVVILRAFLPTLIAQKFSANSRGDASVGGLFIASACKC